MKTQFHFAGFSWPRHVVELPKGRLVDRLAAFKRGERREASPYYHQPAPLAGAHPGRGFYHNDAGMPGLRWQWADDVTYDDGRAVIGHTGWYTDDDGAGDTMRGIVFRLPHGRGFLYGWSLGEGMASSVEGAIWPGDDERGAARAADQCAEHAAEKEREYQSRWRAAIDLDDDISEACEDLRALRRKWSSAFRAWIDARQARASVAAGAMLATMRQHREAFAERAEELHELRARLPEFADVER